MALKAHHLRPAPGAKTDKHRVGRGEGGEGDLRAVMLFDLLSRPHQISLPASILRRVA